MKIVESTDLKRNQRREVAFMELSAPPDGDAKSRDDEFVTAQRLLRGDSIVTGRRTVRLKESAIYTLKAYLDQWVDGNRSQRFHSFEKTQHDGKYVDCWSFENGRERLIGAVSSPFEENQRFELLVLVTVFMGKASHAFPTHVLDRILGLRNGPGFASALKLFVLSRKAL